MRKLLAASVLFLLPSFAFSAEVIKPNIVFARQHLAGLYDATYPGDDPLVLHDVIFVGENSQTLGVLDIVLLDGATIYEVGVVRISGTHPPRAKKAATKDLQTFLSHCVLKRCFYSKDGELLGIAILEPERLRVGYYLYKGGKGGLKMAYFPFPEGGR